MQRVGIGDGGNVDDERVEIVVIVLAFGVVMRGPSVQIVLGGGAQPEQHVGRRRAPSRVATIFTARGIAPAISRAALRAASGDDEIGLVEHDESAHSNWSS